MSDSTDPWHDILACPACGAALAARPDAFTCRSCGHSYPVEKRIPHLYRPVDRAAARGDVTDAVREFYEETPFPNYDDLESRDSLARKATRSIFARLLDEQMPRGCAARNHSDANGRAPKHRTHYGAEAASFGVERH